MDIYAILGGVATGVIYALIFVGVVGGFLFWFLYLRHFKNKMIIRLLTAGKDVVFIKKFRKIQKVGTAPRYELLFPKQQGLPKYAPVAPKDSIDLNAKGGFLIEVWLDNQGMFTYIKNEFANPETGEKKIEYTQHEKLSNGTFTYIKNDKSDLNKRIAIDTADKEFYSEGYRETIARYSTQSWMKEHGMFLIGVGTFLIIIVMLLIYWGDITKPGADAASSAASAAESMDSAMGKMDSWLSKMGLTESKPDDGRPPPD